MYCEARTPTGLGCDSLGLAQCRRCLQHSAVNMCVCHTAKDVPINECIRHYLDQCPICEAYQAGHEKPNYPVPAIPLIVERTKYAVYIVDAMYPSNRDYRIIHYR